MSLIDQVFKLREDVDSLRKTLDFVCSELGLVAGAVPNVQRKSPQPVTIPDGRARKQWSAKESAQLMEMENMGVDRGEMAKVLGRSRSSINCRAWVLAQKKKTIDPV